MKDEILWTKTILSVYRYLERLTNAIDKIVLKSGLNSRILTGQNYYYNNVLSISQKIIDMSQRKITLINLKILTEDVLAKLSKNDANILIQRYFDGQKCKDISENSNISIRTVFRRLDSAEEAFSRKLLFCGYNAKKLSDFLKEEKWIQSVYQRFQNKMDDAFCLSNGFIERAIIM